MSWKKLLVVAFGCSLTGTVYAIALSKGVSADATSHVIPAKDAPIPPVLMKLITINAKYEGVKIATLQEVAGTGEEEDRAGLILGTDDQGRDYVSSFTALNFVGFTPVIDVVAAGRDVAVNTASAPDSHGQVGEVMALGIASPRVARVMIDLTNGETREVALVVAGRSKCSFFTYVSTDSASFPTIVHGYGANGKELIIRDISVAGKPPPPLVRR
jgi:hypothetical protein